MINFFNQCFHFNAVVVFNHINLQGQHLLSSFTIILHYTNNLINHDTLPTQGLTGLQTRVSFVLLLDDFPMFVNHEYIYYYDHKSMQ